MPNTSILIPIHAPGEPEHKDEVRIRTEATEDGRFHITTTQKRNGKDIKHTNAYLGISDARALYHALGLWLDSEENR